ncbi:uncharacterized protein LOC116189307 [Punica granatum]|uniref:Myb/SANT-like domain-containing protein n=2 Tax=Punica granatum TaxID=22663 RepID=A0A218XQY2_PUNGR|nr:uncharacterized protein LOC116189307 [Punica granatum]XP_031374770.1 uncharacterized protein LOC116189307 [Punica granatum]OWM86921.1 hypothetical protein CDL15_Pgr015957 [Punica granatum]PKI38411.1 hypothetical protein CRG98_041191 [Punica granatum]
MAPKGEGIVEWTNDLESAFIEIMLDKFERTHTSSWKGRDWEKMNKELEEQFPGVILGAEKLKQKARRLKIQYNQFTELIEHTGVGWDGLTNTVKASPDVWDKFIKRNSNFRTFRSKGCKHYDALKTLFKASTATGALRISSTDPPKGLRTCERVEEQFLAAPNSRGEEPIDLEEGSGDSDDPVHEVDEPVVTASRRQVRKRSSNTDSLLQECIDLFKHSMNKKKKAKKCTPSKTKRSKSVTSPEKPAMHSIEAAMAVLNEMWGTISIDEYLAGSARIAEHENWRRAFMCFYDGARREWLRRLVGP